MALRLRAFMVVTIAIGTLILTFLAPLGSAAAGPREGDRRGGAARENLTIPPAPSFGPPQRGHIYGGPFPPPYPFYYPYGAYAPPPYPWGPPAPGYAPPSYAPPVPDAYNAPVIPAGRLALLVDPVSAEVFVDGHRLTQHPDLSYEVGLLVGSHTVTVRKEGYEAFEQAIEIPPNQRIMLTVRLRPAE